MDTYMNKWHPWVQTRNNPKYFSPSLSPHTSPAAGFIPHTHRCAQISISVSPQWAPGAFRARIAVLFQRHCGTGSSGAETEQGLGVALSLAAASPSHFPWTLPLHPCPREGLSPRAAPSCDVPDTSPQPLPTPWSWRVCFCDLSSEERRINPETLTGPHTLNSLSLPVATQIWLSQETKGFQVVQAQPLKTCSKSSNLPIY